MVVYNYFISKLDWKKLRWKFGEVAGNGLDIRYGKKRDRANETTGIGGPWESDQGLGRAQTWTEPEKKRENTK
jgi:hypothetical protein